MADNNQVTATSIADLPNEILEILFKMNDSDGELKVLRLVCHWWKDVVDNFVGRKLSIGDNHQWLDDEDDHSQVRNCRHGLHLIGNMAVKSLSIMFNDASLDEVPAMLKYPGSLRKLSLSGCIPESHFRQLTSNLWNLQSLHLSMSVLYRTKMEDFKNLDMPSLRELVIGGDDILTMEYVALRDLQVFLECNTFPMLSKLTVKVSLVWIGDFDTIRKLVQFLQKHPGLASISLGIMAYPNFDGGSSLRFSNQELQSLTEEVQNSDLCSALTYLNFEGTQWTHTSYPQMTMWIPLIQNQRSLRSINTDCIPIPDKVLDLIVAHNGATLQTLIIRNLQGDANGIGNENLPELDLTRLESLVNLRELELVSGFLELELSTPILRGVHRLPRSLRKISIFGKIRSEDLDLLVQDFPTLLDVSLMDVSDDNTTAAQGGGFGFTVDCLRRLVQTRRIYSLEVIGSCLSYESRTTFPINGIPNGDPVDEEMLLISCRWGFHWVLNERGYYHNTL